MQNDRGIYSPFREERRDTIDNKRYNGEYIPAQEARAGLRQSVLRVGIIRNEEPDLLLHTERCHGFPPALYTRHESDQVSLEHVVARDAGNYA